MPEAPANPTDPAPETGNPPADPPTDPPADPPADPDPEPTRPERQAARYRTERNEAQAALQAAQQAQTDLLARLTAALGGEAAPEADPAEQVTALTGQVESLTGDLAAARAELLVHELAGEANANAVALLDSRSFLNSLQALDVSADDYRTQVASAIKDAVSKNANLRSKGQGPARGGASGSGQGSESPEGAVTREQFDAMDYRGKSELFRTNPDLYRRLSGN